MNLIDIVILTIITCVVMFNIQKILRKKGCSCGCQDHK